MQKRGKRNGVQRYFCRFCRKSFHSKHRKKGFQEKLWKYYFSGKQTQEELAVKYKKSREWINKELEKVNIGSNKNKKISPQKIVLVVDTTYFKHFGIMLFRAENLGKNLLWYQIDHETNDLYREGIQELLDDEWNIAAIVADGKPGLGRMFPDIPFQMCQFHMFQIITRYISRKPKLEAGKELRELLFLLTETDKQSFQKWLEDWHERWKNFLVEKTVDPFTGKSAFTHKRLRSAYNSLKRNLDVLFTFQFHSQELQIPNTTNSIDGYFSHLKAKLNVHRGASSETQIKLISSLIFS